MLKQTSYNMTRIYATHQLLTESNVTIMHVYNPHMTM